MAVEFDAGDDEVGFGFGEEFPRCGGVFGEVDDEEVADYAQDAGEETFDLGGCQCCVLVDMVERTYDEDPSPAFEICQSIHLHDAVC